MDVFLGSELCRHTATVGNYASLEGDDFLIIGGYESGIDAAYHLSKLNKKVSVFDMNNPWDSTTSDPSVSLSVFSFERMRSPNFHKKTELFPGTQVNSVTLDNGVYELETEDGRRFHSEVQPLLAGGFSGSHNFVSHLFEQREDSFPLLSECDESTVVLRYVSLWPLGSSRRARVLFHLQIPSTIWHSCQCNRYISRD